MIDNSPRPSLIGQDASFMSRDLCGKIHAGDDSSTLQISVVLRKRASVRISRKDVESGAEVSVCWYLRMQQVSKSDGARS